MNVTPLLLLCAVTLALAEQPQLTLSGKVCNCNPNEAANVCSKTESNGQLIAHENCNQFYKCSNGAAVPYYCNDILLYNPLAEICDWPENVECGNRPIVKPGTEEDCSEETNAGSGNGNNNGGTDDNNNGGNCNPEEAPAICAADGSDGILVAHENCNQFYKCAQGVPVALNCPSGLLYNPHTEQCDWAYNVDCGDRHIKDFESGGNNGEEDCDTDSGNGENGSGSGNGEDSGNGDNGGSTCNCNPGEAPSICSADGSDGVLVAHENCNQFYKCAQGVPVALNCPSGLLYNPHTEQCDWANNVDCGDRHIQDFESGGNNGEEDCDTDSGNGENGSGSGNGEDSGNGDNGGSTCNCNPGEAPSICSADGSDGVLVAHENCNQFYKCAQGVPVALNCPSGLLYNPHTEQCDWASNVDCGDRHIQDFESGGNNGEEDCDTDSGNGENGSGSGNGEDSGNGDNGGSTCNCNPGEAPSICSADGSDGVLVAHENCNQFYKCAQGVPVALNCPSGLLYNPHTEQCDWANNVDCGDRHIQDFESGGNNGEEDCDTDSGNGENGSGSGNGEDSGNGDNGGSTCNCNPGEAPSICSANGSDGVLVAHENCNQFYKCDHGVPVTFDCNNNLMFNPYTEQCDWPHNVDCGDRPIIEIGGGDNGEGGGDNGSEGDNGSSGGNDDNETGGGTCNCNPGEAPGICAADGSDGILVAHENCNQFYKCNHGVPVTFNCNNNLMFNPYTEQCDWPHNVDCGDRPIIEIGGDDNGEGGGDNGSEGDNGSSGGNDDNETGGGTCNCNPGEAPGICAADGSDGILVAHENCNQFYKCNHGVPVTFNCNNNLMFNPYTEQCDWPHNVDCGDRPIIEIGGGDNGEGGGDNGSEGDNGSSGGNDDNETGGGTCKCNPGEAPGICAADGSDGIIVAHENCNQFYKCNHGVPVTFNCNNNLMFNPYTEQCDWPHNVDCGDRPIIEIGGGDNGGGGGDNGSEGDNGSSGGNDNNETGGGTCNCNPGEAPGICAADGSDGILIAHENCNQFYKCDHGVPVTFNCNNNLMFNPYTEQCDWPDNVDCGDRPIIEIGGGDNGEGGGDNGSEGDNGSSGGNDNNETGGGTCNCNPGEAPGICAADGSDGILVAHENCNQFYKCNHGVPVTFNCNNNLMFNPYTEQCDWPHNVDCGDRPIIEIGGGDNGEGGGDNGSEGDNGSSGGNDDNETGGGTCNCNPGEAPGICAADGSDGILVAHENCNQFYKCNHGVPVTFNCNNNLMFNPYTEQCDWPHNVDCGDRPIIEIGGGDNGEGGGDNGSEGDNGSSGGNDDNETGGGTCNCNPGEAPGICAADGSDGILVAHENCNQFYKCNHGVPVTFNCNNNLMFNPYTEQCDWPHNVDCGDRPIIEIGGGDNGEGGGDNGSEGDNGSSGGNDDNETGGGTCNCNPGEAPGICAADGSDGIIVAHENCNQFYKCNHGVPVTFNCNNNLMFNPYTEQCDWPHNVDCGDRPIIEIGGGDNGGGGGDNGSEGDNGSSGGNDNNETGGGTCNCNPGEAPGICAADGSDGILIAHENCNQFYKCDHGVPVTFNCNNNLMFNPYTEQCDWPDNVDCGDRPIIEIGGGDNGEGGGDNGSEGDNGSSGGNDNNETGGGTCNCNPGEAPGICAADGSDGILVAHENCNQFYKCNHGVPVTFNCNNNLMFNPYTEQCDWPHNVDCGDRPIIEIGGGDNGEGGGDNGSEGDNGSSGGNDDNETGGGTCNCNPGEAPGICAADGSDGILVAHENCNQFYKCNHGVPVTFNCNNNLMFNPYTEQCDWPHNVDCGDRPIIEIGGGDNGEGGGDNGSEGDNGSSGGNDDNETGGGTCNCNPGEAPGICAADGSDGILVAHENCNQFYKCNHGVPVTFNCNNNLMFNPYTEQCDWPHNVDCGDRPIIEIGGGDNGEGGGDNGSEGDNGSSGGNDDNETGGGTCNCNPGEAPGICAADGSDGILVAHENCNQFYKCNHGVPVTFNCNNNLMFNPYTEQCDWPHNVDCGDRPIIEIGGGDNGEGGGDNGSEGDNGSSGGNDNNETGGGTCNCNPGEAPGICAADGSDGILIAHENCNQFYKCDHGVPVTFNCNNNLMFNPYTEQCDWPHNVDCGNRPIIEIGGGDNGEGGGDNGNEGDNGSSGGNGDNDSSSQNDENDSGSENGDNCTSESTCNCNPSEAPSICAADDSEGVLVAHENCNQFYKCAHGLPVTFNCHNGLLYNPITERCDWPDNVDCGKRPIVEVDEGGNDGGGENGDNGTGEGTCNCNPGEAPSICAADSSDGILVAHENCNQFYQCSHGVPVTINCNKHLVYNPFIERCDWPENVDCGDRPIVEVGGGDNGEGGGDNGNEGDNGVNGESGGNCDPSEAPAICANKGSDGVLVAHENCDKFYVCTHGHPVALECPSNLLYNPKIEDCDWPRNVECGDRIVPEPESGGDSPCACNSKEAPAICADSGSNGKLIAHENCNQYYVCFDGSPVARSCPQTLFYDPHTEQCLWPATVSCEGRAITAYSSLNKHRQARRGFF